MSHHVIGLDPDEMTPRQLRLALRQAASIASMQARRQKQKPKAGDEDDDEEDDSPSDEESDNDDLVNLHEEQKGSSNPPKLTKDDLPKGVKVGKDKSEKEKS